MYLIDTNVFLEVLLSQEKKEKCKKFLDDNIENLHISDFSLHSIGVILFRNKKEDAFQKFISDIFPKVEIVTLSKWSYEGLVEIKRKSGLDFDDAYQYKIAKDHDLKVVTMDTDFEETTDLDVIFL